LNAVYRGLDFKVKMAGFKRGTKRILA
jgi:hypothetical protein